MIKIEIKSIFGAVIFTHESEKNTVKETVEAMLKKYIEEEKQIREANFSDMDLSGIDFDNSSFDNSSFYNSRFDNSSFDNSSFDNSSFYNSRFDNSSFDNSSFYNSSFDNSSFYNSRFDNSSFDNSRFYNSSFDNSSFDNSSFYNSRFDNSSFDNSSFDNSSFDNSSFYNSRFDNSSFDNSSFDNSRFYNSRFDNSRFDNKTISNIRAASQLKMFDSYKHDFWAILLKSQPEIAGLKTAIREGKIDGSTYTGECACLVGTIANVKNCSHQSIPGISPDANRPAELWFTALQPGMTPENSEAAKLTLEWIEEFEFFLTPPPSPVEA